MSEKHVHSELIKLWADGAEIEYFDDDAGKWFVVISPAWEKCVKYRIKQTPKPDEVRYGIAILEDGFANVKALGPKNLRDDNNLKLTFDGETGKLKSAEVIWKT